LEITPSYNINYLIINITVEGGAYYIKKSTDINIDRLKSYNSYYFIIESSLFNYILINLTMNYNHDDKPFDDFYIYKYEDINNVSLYLNKTSHSFKTSTNSNKLICWYNFTVYDNYTKYIIAKIKPKYNLQNLITKIIVKGGAFYLEEGRNTRINGLKSSNTYLFLLNASLLQKVNFTLTSYYSTDLPYYFYIDEYKDITDISTYLKTSYQKPSLNFIEKWAKFTYFVTNKNTKYIGLKITHYININSIFINFTVENHLFELSSGEKKNFYGFIIGSTYYIFLVNKKDKNIKVTMNLDGYIEEPFSYLYVYELYKDYQIDYYYRKRIIYVEKDSADKNKRSIIYSPFYSGKQIVLEITPNSSLISMICELEYLDKFPIGTLILIIFICLFFLITIICIIKRCKKRREANLMADPMVQSLQPIDESPQEENTYNPNQACPKEISNEDPYKNQQQQQYGQSQ
jgi:hypothetical protein